MMRRSVLMAVLAGVGSLLVFSVVALATLWPASPDTPLRPVSEEGETLPPEAVYSAPPQESGEPQYLLRAQDGVIAVFRPENPGTPERLTDIPVCSLRLADQALLHDGIWVGCETDLLLLLEDFGS